MSIKPGLIIYHAKRYQPYPQICSKYRLVPDHLDYHFCNLKFRNNSRIRIPRSHHISTVSHSVDLSHKIPKRLAQLSTQPSYLRKLRLFLYCSRDEQNESSRLIKKVLWKLLLKAKRVSNIEIELENEKGHRTSILKHFALLRSVKNIKLRLFSAQRMTFQALQDLLFSSKTRKRLPYFEYAYLQFELKPENVMNREFLDNYLVNFSEALTQYRQSPMIERTHFKIRLPFFVVPDSTNAQKFFKSIENFPQLMSLGQAFESLVPQSLPSQIVNNIQNLEVLDFCLAGSHTELLPQVLQKAVDMKSLKKLVIWMRRIHIEPVKVFFSELKRLQQIERLILNCENCGNIDDEMLGILSHSLGKLMNLKKLEINLNIKSEQDVKRTADGLDLLFRSFGKLRKLEEFHLLLNGFGEEIPYKLYEGLFNSLRMMKELSSLALFFQGNRFEEIDLTLFDRYLKRSSSLQSLILNFQGLSAINSEALSKFIKSFGLLKTLKTLSLKLRCTELNDGLVFTLFSTISNLRGLDGFVLNLLSEQDQYSFIPLHARSQLVKLGEKMSIAIESI